MARRFATSPLLTDTLVLQCNDDRSLNAMIQRRSTRRRFRSMSILVRNNGFPNVMVIEQSGSDRPLIIARTT